MARELALVRALLGMIFKLTDTEETLMYIWWIAGFIWAEITGQIIWGR